MLSVDCCTPEMTCNFVRYYNRRIRDSAVHHVVNNTGSLEECVRICIEFTTFNCLSTSYSLVTSVCTKVLFRQMSVTLKIQKWALMLPMFLFRGIQSPLMGLSVEIVTPVNNMLIFFRSTNHQSSIHHQRQEPSKKFWNVGMVMNYKIFALLSYHGCHIIRTFSYLAYFFQNRLAINNKDNAFVECSLNGYLSTYLTGIYNY